MMEFFDDGESTENIAHLHEGHWTFRVYHYMSGDEYSLFIEPNGLTWIVYKLYTLYFPLYPLEDPEVNEQDLDVIFA